jgi:hypothetical protein
MLLIVNSHDSDRLDEIERMYPASLVSTYPTDIPDKSFLTVLIPAE